MTTSLAPSSNPYVVILPLRFLAPPSPPPFLGLVGHARISASNPAVAGGGPVVLDADDVEGNKEHDRVVGAAHKAFRKLGRIRRLRKPLGRYLHSSGATHKCLQVSEE